MESKAQNKKNHGGMQNKYLRKKNIKRTVNLSKFYQKYEQLINLILDMITGAQNSENMCREKMILRKNLEKIRPNVIDPLNKVQKNVSKYFEYFLKFDKFMNEPFSY